MAELNGVTPLAKIQKNAQLEEGLCKVLDMLQRRTGATFSRLTTAAFLKYLFSPVQPPKGIAGEADETIWMKIAVDLERGDFTVQEVPERVIEQYVEVAGLALSAHNTPVRDASDDGAIARWNAVKSGAFTALKRWHAVCADHGGETAALEFILNTGGFQQLFPPKFFQS